MARAARKTLFELGLTIFTLTCESNSVDIRLWPRKIGSVHGGDFRRTRVPGGRC